MQTDLQVLLVIVGIVFGIYIMFNLFKRRDKKADQDEDFDQTVMAKKQVSKDRDPLLDDNGIVGTARKKTITEGIVGEAREVTHQPPHTEEYNEMPETRAEAPATYIAITVVAKNPEGLSGATILNTLKANHYHYHKQGVFNRHTGDNPSMPVMFSVLSMREPGIFRIEEMPTQFYEGMVLLLVLQGTTNPSAIFEKMLTSARQLAVMLEGELCDDKRTPLTAHSMARLREKIQESHRRTLTYQNNTQNRA